MEYDKIKRIDRHTAQQILEHGNTEEKIAALLGLVLNDPDPVWLQELCIDIIVTTADLWLQRNAITCLGHIARIHGQIDEKVVRPLLLSLKKDSELAGFVEDTLGDLDVFLPKKSGNQ